MVHNSSLTLSRFCEYPLIKGKCTKMSGSMVDFTKLCMVHMYMYFYCPHQNTQCMLTNCSTPGQRKLIKSPPKGGNFMPNKLF